MMPLFRLRGLRARVMLSFGLGALLVSTTFAVVSYSVASSYLVRQRETTVTRLAFSDANFVRDRFATAGVRVPDILTAVDPPEQTSVVIRRDQRWYASALKTDVEDIPDSLRKKVAAGNTANIRAEIDGKPSFVIGVPLDDDTLFFEIAVLEELQDTLRILGIVLGAGALGAALVGAGVGIWASRSVVRPLNDVAGTAAQIAAGQLDTRLAATRDPDLATIVGSFNSMVDTLQQRVERDARLAADVSHELRSPLTTLVASVDVLNGRRAELSERGQRALDLVTDELDRFRRLLDNLLELARMDAGLDSPGGGPDQESFPLFDLLSHTLVRYGHSARLLSGDTEVQVSGNKVRLERVFANLFDNADRHADGLTAVSVRLEQDRVLVLVDDDGPGVPRAERDHVFERFATGPSARGSSTGTGLGLTLVSETVAAHGGAVWCTDRPGDGGARFVVSLPKDTS